MTNYAKQLEALHLATSRSAFGPMLPLVKPARSEIISSETRIGVYADGYLERLIGAILADYPALANYLGEGKCRNLAERFVKENSSREWDLNRYTPAFAAFIKSELADDAADIAALEGAIADVFWRSESPPATASKLAEQGEGALENLRLRTAAIMLQLAYHANAYLTAFRATENPEAPKQGAEWVCVIRHEDEVRRVILEKREFDILSGLANGQTLGEALAAYPDPETLAPALPGYMAKWLENGVLS